MSEHLTELDQKHRQTTTLTHPMKWWKFLIYFSLFAGALLTLSTGIQYLSGRIYLSQGLTQNDIELFYSLYPPHKTLDTIYGIICFGLAAFAIIARFRLDKYHRTGPMCIYILPSASLFFSSVYTILSYKLVYVDISQFLPQIYGQIIGQLIVVVIYVWLNYVYFRKRRALFTNG